MKCKSIGEYLDEILERENICVADDPEVKENIVQTLLQHISIWRNSNE